MHGTLDGERLLDAWDRDVVARARHGRESRRISTRCSSAVPAGDAVVKWRTTGTITADTPARRCSGGRARRVGADVRACTPPSLNREQRPVGDAEASKILAPSLELALECPGRCVDDVGDAAEARRCTVPVLVFDEIEDRREKFRRRPEPILRVFPHGVVEEQLIESLVHEAEVVLVIHAPLLTQCRLSGLGARPRGWNLHVPISEIRPAREPRTRIFVILQTSVMQHVHQVRLLSADQFGAVRQRVDVDGRRRRRPRLFDLALDCAIGGAPGDAGRIVLIERVELLLRTEIAVQNLFAQGVLELLALDVGENLQLALRGGGRRASRLIGDEPLCSTAVVLDARRDLGGIAAAVTR